jgi:hypothetical protein
MRECLASTVLLAAAMAASASTREDWSGAYVGVAHASGELRVTASGDDQWRLRWQGGGDDTQGAATSAQCIAVAQARALPANPSHWRAELQPFDEGDQALDAADLAALRPPPLDLQRLPADPAVVLRVEGAFPHCGLQAALSGLYWRPSPVATGGHPLSEEFRRCRSGAGDCMAAEHALQDHRLNETWKVVLARLVGSARAAVRHAQRQWLAERERACAAQTDRPSCETQAAAQRADELAALARTLAEDSAGR